MKQFSCGAVVAGCTATFEAEKDEQILAPSSSTRAGITGWPRSQTRWPSR